MGGFQGTHVLYISGIKNNLDGHAGKVPFLVSITG